MTDVHTKEQRSYNMSQIKGSNTKIELSLKNFLENKKFIYQPYGYGKPDFINYRMRIVIFIDGCFWHKCPYHYISPKSNKKFWSNKINKNLRRDKEVTLNYKNSGWKVVRVWEHETRLGKLKNLNY